MSIFKTIWFRVMLVFTLFGIALFIFINTQFSSEFKRIILENETARQNIIMHTILPVIQINLVFDLQEENRNYLRKIMEKNGDIASIVLKNSTGEVLYEHRRDGLMGEDIVTVFRSIKDTHDKKELGEISLGFFSLAIKQAESAQRSFEIRLYTIMTLIFLALSFSLFRIFRPLHRLVVWVKEYDPKTSKADSFKLCASGTEVTKIGWAITHMLQRIDKHTKELDCLNLALEERVKERTAKLIESNLQLQEEIIKSSRAEAKLMQANKKLSELSRIDELTKLANRRFFNEHLKRVWDICIRKSTPITVIMCDLDHFKKINDTFGHVAGDMVLVAVAEVLKSSVRRSTDLVARYGGEEFIIILFDANEGVAIDLVSDIQEKLKSVEITTESADVIRDITLSFGICSHEPTKNDSVQECIEYADKALYKAKRGGRDRFCLFTATDYRSFNPDI